MATISDFHVFVASNQVETDVSFSVYATRNQDVNFLEVISFEGVTTNQGGHFNTADSVYTCPLSGTYFFTFSMFAFLSDLRHTSPRLWKDEEAVSEARCTIYSSQPDNLQCSNSAVVHCEEGQRVFLAANVANTEVWTSWGPTSIFSGFLIHADVSPYIN